MTEPRDDTAETISRRSLESQAADLLRRQILSGELRAGERLLEIPIAQRCRLSRGTIRAALRRLVEEGLVCHFPYTGYQVIDFSDHDLWELYTLRGALERLGTRLAALRIDGEGIGHLRAAFAQLEAAAESEDHERADRLDRELHKLIIRLSGHERLLQHYLRVENQFRVYIALSNREVDAREICESHRDLVESICGGDADRAERLAAANIVPPDQIPKVGCATPPRPERRVLDAENSDERRTLQARNQSAADSRPKRDGRRGAAGALASGALPGSAEPRSAHRAASVRSAPVAGRSGSGSRRGRR